MKLCDYKILTGLTKPLVLLHTHPSIPTNKQMAMEIAQAPAKGLLMQGFMMYMTGNSVSIISIMIVGMCLLNSTKALAAVSQRTYIPAMSTNPPN